MTRRRPIRSAVVIAARVAACLALLSVTSCSLIDGLSGEGEPDRPNPIDPPDPIDPPATCTADDDCSIVDEACSTNGCFPFPTGAFGVCFSDADCNGASQVDLPCPRGECSCLTRVRTCVMMGGACSDNIECAPLEFCHVETGRCLQPYECTTHSNCINGLCATEGCVSEAETSAGAFCNGDADCPMGSTCLSARCFRNDLSTVCRTSPECGPGAFCAFETSSCMVPVEDNGQPIAGSNG